MCAYIRELHSTESAVEYQTRPKGLKKTPLVFMKLETTDDRLLIAEAGLEKGLVLSDTTSL